ncbi:hypothetical protein KIN20_014732 [Parelaphostrongylus tenuis]|uniref:Uncharacterized protein n=1 Tax=Parelaphostrongylus tenuis TaxID=148309 RepID=A0AAD5MIP5_PARTN|nr:hypothetical protein KIN20_014732 [Parelaphostrongylus tenuis]
MAISSRSGGLQIVGRRSRILMMQEETFTSEDTEAGANTVKDETAHTEIIAHNSSLTVEMVEAIPEREMDSNMVEVGHLLQCQCIGLIPLTSLFVSMTTEWCATQESMWRNDVDMETGILCNEDTTEKVLSENCSIEIRSSEHYTIVEAETQAESTEAEADTQAESTEAEADTQAESTEAEADTKAESAGGEADQEIEPASAVEDQMDTTQLIEEEGPKTPPPSAEASQLRTPEDQGRIAEAELDTRRSVAAENALYGDVTVGIVNTSSFVPSRSGSLLLLSNHEVRSRILFYKKKV